MDAPDRLNELLATPGSGLDRVLAVLATVDPIAPPTEDAIVAKIDALAQDCPEPHNPAGVLDHVYGTYGFSGDLKDYYDPANSLIHYALHRRRGIPLTLAAIATEVGRRLDVRLHPVGMPGHVLLGETGKADRWYDPFNRGAELGYEDCRRLFAQFHPVDAFSPAMLTPMTAEAVAIRTLNNLKVAYGKRGDLSRLVPVLEMRANMVSADVGDRIELANTLSALGRYQRAAEEYTRLAETDPERQQQHRARAQACQAHQN